MKHLKRLLCKLLGHRPPYFHFKTFSYETEEGGFVLTMYKVYYCARCHKELGNAL